MKNLLYLFFAGLFVTLTACAGGGNSEETTTQEAVVEEATDVMGNDTIENDISNTEADSL